MVGILAQVDDIFSWASRGGKLIGTRWGMRIQGHGYLYILCRCNIRRSATGQREHGFLLDQPYPAPALLAISVKCLTVVSKSVFCCLNTQFLLQDARRWNVLIELLAPHKDVVLCTMDLGELCWLPLCKPCV